MLALRPVPRRARIQGPKILASLNSRLESDKEEKEGWDLHDEDIAWCRVQLPQKLPARTRIKSPFSGLLFVQERAGIRRHVV